MTPDFQRQLRDFLNDSLSGEAISENCLSDEEILLYVHNLVDELPERERTRIAAHIRDTACPRCSELVALMSRAQASHATRKTEFLRAVPSTEPKLSTVLWHAFEPIVDSLRRLKIPAIATAMAFGVLVLGLALGPQWSARRGPIKTLAVAPFTGSNPEGDTFASTLPESVARTLGGVSQLRVVSWAGGARDKGESADPDRIARDLHVRAVLTGQLVKRDNGVMIQAALRDTYTDRDLWTHEYAISNILDVRQDMVQELSVALRLKLSVEQRRRLDKRPTDDPEAYRLYLEARHYLKQRNLDKAIDYFQQAIRRDGNFALAYAGLGDSYGLRGWYEQERPKEAYKKAHDAASTALALNGNLAEAHSTLAMIYSDHERNWSNAEKEYKLAIELNPSYPTAHEWYGLYLVAVGRSKEGLDEVRQAEQLDPVSPMIVSAVAEALYFSRDYDQAIEQYRKALGIDPSFQPALRGLACAYATKGMYGEATETLSKLLRASPDDPRGLSVLGYVLSRSNQKPKVQGEVLRPLEERRPVPAYWIAVVYAALGDTESAFRWLERSFEEQSAELLYLRVAPYFDSLRDDTRFSNLLLRLNLPSRIGPP